MKKMIVLLIGAGLLGIGWNLSVAEDSNASARVVKVKAKLDAAPPGQAVVRLMLAIDKNWHLYANPVNNPMFTNNQVVVSATNADATFTYPTGKPFEFDAEKFNIYEDTVEIRAVVKREVDAENPLKLRVRVCACNDKECLPPATIPITVP